jgi:hypothetical protein
MMGCQSGPPGSYCRWNVKPGVGVCGAESLLGAGGEAAVRCGFALLIDVVFDCVSICGNAFHE